MKFTKSRRSLRNSWNFSYVTLRSHALRLVFRKMQYQAYDDAVNIAGKTSGVAAFMLTDNQKSSCTEHAGRECMRSDGNISLP